MSEQGLFNGTACYYAKYRPGYPGAFFDFVADYFDLDGQGRLLDLGCGTGQIAIPLAKYFREVIGLDIERGMLDEARKEAEKAGVKNIRWVLRRAEDISDDLGTFRLTTMGASFHWMEQDKVLRRIYEITESGGGAVIVSDSSSPWRDENAERWKGVRKQIVMRYLGEKRRAGNSFYTEPRERFEDVIARSMFEKYEEWKYEYDRRWTLDQAVGFLYSTSFASRRLFGGQLGLFEEELRKELLYLQPSGVFTERIYVQALVVRK